MTWFWQNVTEVQIIASSVYFKGKNPTEKLSGLTALNLLSADEDDVLANSAC